MRRGEWIGVQAMGLATTLLVGNAHGQSFDCNKASTPVEYAICSDKALGELDTTLATQMKESMSNANLEQRADLLREQRQWLKSRNQHCAPAALNAGEPLPQCLAAAYRDRIASLKSPEATNTSICKKIADRYSPVASAHPGEPPLNVLVSLPASGVTLTEPLIRMAQPASEFPEWARKQTPPFIVPDEWIKNLISMGFWTLEKIPDENFYWLSTVGGTAHCYDSHYFVLSNGRAEERPAPRGFKDGEGAACGVSRQFGRIDAARVYLEEDYDGTARMSSSIKAAYWQDGGFRGACTVRFLFAPRFREPTMNSWNTLETESWKSCAGPNCADFHRAAFDLVTAVQKDALQARTRSRSLLSASQLAEYQSVIKLATRDQPGSSWDQDANVDPADIVEQSPFFLPYVYEGRVYLASLGHFTIGWRYFADWSVIFSSLEDGKLMPQGHFAVGMVRGELEKVSVSELH